MTAARGHAERAVPWVTVARATDVPPGTMIGVDVGGTAVLVAHLGDRYVALSDECTHAGCPLRDGELDVERRRLVCWCHGSEYDADSGRVLEPPARAPLAVHPVRVSGDELQVAVASDGGDR